METSELEKVLQQARLELGAIEQGKKPKSRPGLRALLTLWDVPEFGTSLLGIETMARNIDHMAAAFTTHRDVKEKTWPQPESFNQQGAIKQLAEQGVGDRVTIVLAKWFFDIMKSRLPSYRESEAFLDSPEGKRAMRFGSVER